MNKPQQICIHQGREIELIKSDNIYHAEKASRLSYEVGLHLVTIQELNQQVAEAQATIAELTTLTTDGNAVTLAKSLAIQSIKFQKLQNEYAALRIKHGIEHSTSEDSCTYLSRPNA